MTTLPRKLLAMPLTQDKISQSLYHSLKNIIQDDTDSSHDSIKRHSQGNDDLPSDSSTSFCSSDSSITIFDGNTVDQKIKILQPNMEDRVLLKMMNLDFPYDRGDGNPYFTDGTVIAGLEFLVDASRLLIERRPENAIDLGYKDRLKCFSLFDIIDDSCKRVYLAREKTTRSMVRYTRDARLFNLEVFNYRCDKCLIITRTCNCQWICAQYFCFCRLKGCKNVGNVGEVRLGDGTFIGKIIQTGCRASARFIIKDLKGATRMLIEKNSYDKDLYEISYPLKSEHTDRLPVAMLETFLRSSDVRRHHGISVSPRSRPHGLSFMLTQIPVVDKALLLALVLFIDMIKLRKQYFPQLVEFVPDDFKHSQLPNMDLTHWDYASILDQLNSRKFAIERHPNTVYSFCFKFFCCICRFFYARNRIRCYLCIGFTLLCLLLIVLFVLKIIKL